MWRAAAEGNTLLGFLGQDGIIGKSGGDGFGWGGDGFVLLLLDLLRVLVLVLLAFFHFGLLLGFGIVGGECLAII